MDENPRKELNDALQETIAALEQVISVNQYLWYLVLFISLLLAVQIVMFFKIKKKDRWTFAATILQLWGVALLLDWLNNDSGVLRGAVGLILSMLSFQLLLWRTVRKPLPPAPSPLCGEGELGGAEAPSEMGGNREED